MIIVLTTIFIYNYYERKESFMANQVLTEKEIIEKKFVASKNGYNPFEVDKFLDTITLTINELNRQISSLKSEKDEANNKANELNKKLEEVNREFQLFKNKFKNIKEDDFIDNRSNIELLKKVNVYAKKLNELGVDVTKL